MGLDMYLSAKKYLSKYFDPVDSNRIKAINDAFGIEGDEENDYGAQEVIFRVAYWRKANAIHQWFVDNIQDGTDDCGEYGVTREKLEELLDLCKKIIADPKSGKTLMPTASGFFFGSTDYDDYYLQELRYTEERIEKILKDTALTRCDFYYQSSW